MATFKVGDRVRCLVAIGWPEVIGKEALITGIDWEGEYVLDIPGVPAPSDGGYWVASGDGDIAPLTPPAKDEWAAAKVKQVTRPTYMEPVRTKERA